MSQDLTKVKCPHCNSENTWQTTNPYRPFCSYRCKLIDLGEWADEGRRIPGPEAPPFDENDDAQI